MMKFTGHYAVGQERLEIILDRPSRKKTGQADYPVEGAQIAKALNDYLPNQTLRHVVLELSRLTQYGEEVKRDTIKALNDGLIDPATGKDLRKQVL